MSEYEFILGQLVRVIRASDLDDLAKDILIPQTVIMFEEVQSFILEKEQEERQKQFAKQIDD